MERYEKEEELGLKCFSNEDGKNAIKHYKLAIKYGSKIAYAYIGELYLFGICGIKKNLREAIIYINKGVDKVDLLAYERLLQYCAITHDVEGFHENFLRAISIFTTPLEQGRLSCTFVRACCDYGINITQEDINIMKSCICKGYKKFIQKQYQLSMENSFDFPCDIFENQVFETSIFDEYYDEEEYKYENDDSYLYNENKKERHNSHDYEGNNDVDDEFNKNEENDNTLDEMIQDLHKLVGLNQVKEEIDSLINLINVRNSSAVSKII